MNHPERSRSVIATHPAQRDDIADLVTRRPLPSAALAQLDPFLFLNHHGPQVYRPRNNGLPFGPHPHRGFETVTFILEGDIAHADTGGHQSVIDAGGVQWMTAGSGLVHAEVSSEQFKRDGGPLEVLQLWINLPARLKMVAPQYVGLQREDIPSFELDHGRGQLELISGQWAGHHGPITSITGVHMAIVTLQADATVRLEAPRDRAVFLYVISGELDVSGLGVSAHHLVQLAHDADLVSLRGRSDCRLVFGHADPLGEPVVSHGPFVMNTREEIVQAVHDYQAGKFGQMPA